MHTRRTRSCRVLTTTCGFLSNIRRRPDTMKLTYYGILRFQRAPSSSEPRYHSISGLPAEFSLPSAGASICCGIDGRKSPDGPLLPSPINSKAMQPSWYFRESHTVIERCMPSAYTLSSALRRHRDSHGSRIRKSNIRDHS